MTFPIQRPEEILAYEDLIRLAPLLNRAVRDIIPCNQVHFLGDETHEEILGQSEREIPESWLMGARMARNGQKVIVDKPTGRIYLPIWQDNQMVAAAVLEECDPTVMSAKDAWFHERCRLVSREFRMIKKMSIEPTTGLLSGAYLREELSLFIEDQKKTKKRFHSTGIQIGFSLILIEIYPRSQNSEKALIQISHAASCLESVIGDYSPPFYLGAGLFSCIWQEQTREETLNMGKAILRSLKREGFARTHIGIASAPPLFPSSPEEIMDTAWQALRIARKRGPHALCPHQSEKELASHPLREPSANTMEKFRRLWRSRECFSIALIKQNGWSAESCCLSRIYSLAGPHISVIPLSHNGEAYFYFDNLEGTEAKKQLSTMLEKLNNVNSDASQSYELSFSAGVAMYPFGRFKKNDIPQNARKALLHTSFLGPGTVTVFDGVSLNISGDVYYNEGDLARAAKEYRKGLEVDPLNANLLNSLAVDYAQMNRYGAAIPLFEKALEAEPDHYMSLFNLGHAYISTGDEDNALICFEKAVAIEDRHFDLLLALGELRCRKGNFAAAIDVLEKCEQVGKEEGAWKEGEYRGECENGIPLHGRRRVERGEVHRLLGKAYMALRQNDEAVSCLQRAVRFHPYDAEALSLLGELYVYEKQGDDIALAFCQKAIEIDESNSGSWYSLGIVQHSTGDLAGSIASFRKSLILQQGNSEAAYQLGRIYEEQSQMKAALRMYEKAVRNNSKHEKAKESLLRLGRQ